MSMQKISQLDDVLEKLAGKQKSAEDDMGGKDTSHPSANVDNSTKDDNLEGSRSAENLADNKDEQPIGVEGAGSPEVKEPAGSQGVEDKEPEEKGDMEGDDKSGVSEQLDKDTSHASANGEKRGSSTIDKIIGAFDDLLKSASEDDDEGKAKKQDPPKADDKQAGTDKEAEEEQQKLAEHIEKVAEDHPEHVQAGYNLGLGVIDYLKTAAALQANSETMFGMLKKADMGEEAMQMAPQLGMDEGAGQEDVLQAVADELAAAGVQPEELAQMLSEADAGGGEMGGAPEMGGGGEMGGAPEMGGGEETGGDPLAGAGEDDQIAALEAALGETGTSPEELAQAAAGEGGETAQEEAKVGSVRVIDLKPGSEKLAAAIAEHPEKAAMLATLKDKVVADLKNLKNK